MLAPPLSGERSEGYFLEETLLSRPVNDRLALSRNRPFVATPAAARWSLLLLLISLFHNPFHNYVEYSHRLLKTLQYEGARSPHNTHQRLKTFGFWRVCEAERRAYLKRHQSLTFYFSSTGLMGHHTFSPQLFCDRYSLTTPKRLPKTL